MVIPGFGSNRVPVHVRLFIALSVALALSPLLAPGVQASLPDEQLGTVAGFIGAELLTGAFIGFLGRIFLAALETLTTLVSMAIGLSNMPGMPIDGVDSLPPVANLFTVTATAMVFITNQHWEILRGLAASYEAIPVGQPLAAVTSLLSGHRGGHHDLPRRLLHLAPDRLGNPDRERFLFHGKKKSGY